MEKRITDQQLGETFVNGQILYGEDLNKIIDVLKKGVNANKSDINLTLSGDSTVSVFTNADLDNIKGLGSDGDFAFNITDDGIYIIIKNNGVWSKGDSISLYELYDRMNKTDSFLEVLFEIINERLEELELTSSDTVARVGSLEFLTEEQQSRLDNHTIRIGGLEDRVDYSEGEIDRLSNLVLLDDLTIVRNSNSKIEVSKSVMDDIKRRLIDEDITGFVKNPTYDPVKHVIILPLHNKQDLIIDLPVEMLIKGVKVEGDELVLTFEDGAEARVSMGSLLVGMASEEWVNDNFYKKGVGLHLNYEDTHTNIELGYNYSSDTTRQYEKNNITSSNMGIFRENKNANGETKDTMVLQSDLINFRRTFNGENLGSVSLSNNGMSINADDNMGQTNYHKRGINTNVEGATISGFNVRGYVKDEELGNYYEKVSGIDIENEKGTVGVRVGGKDAQFKTEIKPSTIQLIDDNEANDRGITISTNNIHMKSKDSNINLGPSAISLRDGKFDNVVFSNDGLRSDSGRPTITGFKIPGYATDEELDLKANDNEVVKLSGEQTNIRGRKRFDLLELMSNQRLSFIEADGSYAGRVYFNNKIATITNSRKNGEIAVMSDIEPIKESVNILEGETESLRVDVDDKVSTKAFDMQMLEKLNIKPNGVDSLIIGGKINVVYIDTEQVEANHPVVNSEAEMLSLNVDVGTVVIRTDKDNELWILKELPAADLASWEVISPNTVVSVAGKTGFVTLGITDIDDLPQALNLKLDVSTFESEVSRLEGLLNNKVDKIAGRGLSEQNYTMGERTKVAKLNITGAANTYLNAAGEYTTPPNTTYTAMPESEYKAATSPTARIISPLNLKGAILYHSPAGSRPASDVSAWAKATTKPAYTWEELRNKPAWIGTTKPTYTAAEVGARSNTWNPTLKTINGENILGNGNITVGGSRYYKKRLLPNPDDDGGYYAHLVLQENHLYKFILNINNGLILNSSFEFVYEEGLIISMNSGYDEYTGHIDFMLGTSDGESITVGANMRDLDNSITSIDLSGQYIYIIDKGYIEWEEDET